MQRVGKRLVLGSGFNSIYLAATAAASFLITPFLVQRLGDHHYGVWTLIVVLSDTYNVLELGLSSAVGRFMAGALGAEDKERSNTIFNTALFIFGSGGLLALMLNIFAAG